MEEISSRKGGGGDEDDGENEVEVDEVETNEQGEVDVHVGWVSAWETRTKSSSDVSILRELDVSGTYDEYRVL